MANVASSMQKPIVCLPSLLQDSHLHTFTPPLPSPHSPSSCASAAFFHQVQRMGRLGLHCIVVHGDRLLAMSHIRHTGEIYVPTPVQVVLVRSNPSPPTVTDITWSLVSVSPLDYPKHEFSADTACHVDPFTGIFTAMSNYTSSDNLKSGPQEARGLQYDPRTDSWKDITPGPGYQWGNAESSFTLFSWPDGNASPSSSHSTVYHASFAQPTNGKVRLGMLEQGSDTFVNVTSWTLDPLIYGYPFHVIAGQDTLYQFGELVTDNRPGAIRTIVTKIPLSGNVTSFSPPSSPQYQEVPTLKACNTSTTIAKYYEKSIYIFCSPAGYNSPYNRGGRYLLIFNDLGKNVSENPPYDTGSGFFDGIFQPFRNDDYSRPWIYLASFSEQSELRFDVDRARWKYGARVGAVNIAEPYGYTNTHPPDYTSAITAGVVIGVLIILGLLAFFLRRRYGPKFMSETWPRWKKKITIKIIEILEALRRYAEGHEETGKGTLDRQQNKIEYGSTEDFEGKILVTPDMDLSDLIDPNRSQTQQVESEQGGDHRRHRPTDATTLPTTSIQDGITEEERVGEWSSVNSSSALLPRAAPVSQSQPPVTDKDHIRTRELDMPEGLPSAALLTKKAAEPLDTMVEIGLEQLRSPLPPITIHEPSAPPLDSISPDLGEARPGSHRSSSS
ncbi:MAG: hypothetical protein J3Q66DRAFT_202800, partial [Benniella sp.]